MSDRDEIFNKYSGPQPVTRADWARHFGIDPLDLVTKHGYSLDQIEPDPNRKRGILDKIGEFAGTPGGSAILTMLGFLSKSPASSIATPKGIPATVKFPGGEKAPAAPLEGVMDAARDYMTRSGRIAEYPAEFPKLDPKRARSVAQAFDAAEHAPADHSVKKSYDALTRETLEQYDALNRQGYKFEFMKPDGKGGVIDPYAASPSLGYKDLRDAKRLEIFPTDAGYGSGASKLDVSQNPMLADSGRMFGDRPATVNDVFRAVHDAYGHFGHGNPFFRAPGEERAWSLHAPMFSPEARRALTSETRGQNSWVNFGPHAKENAKASGADTVYAPQKTALMPEWTSTEGLANPNLIQRILSAYGRQSIDQGVAP